MVMGEELRVEMIEVLEPEDQKPIEALLPQRLNEPFGISVHVRGFETAPQPFHMMPFQFPEKPRRELPIPVGLNNADLQSPAPYFLNKLPGLLRNPLVVGVKRRRRENNLPGFDMHKRHYKRIP